LKIEAFAVYHLPTSSEITSLASDRSGNASFTDGIGWVLTSIGWDGMEIFRVSLPQPHNVLLPGTLDKYFVLNDLDRNITCFDRNGQQISKIGYAGFTANAGVATTSGDIYLLNGVNGQIKVMSQLGYELRNFSIEMPARTVFRPTVITVDPANNLMALGDSRTGIIEMYNLYGTRQGSLNVPFGSHLQAICFDHKGRLWICQPELNEVSVYADEANRWTFQVKKTFNRPYAITMGPFGSGVVAETANLVFVRY
jgi:hypothetical protein